MRRKPTARSPDERSDIQAIQDRALSKRRMSRSLSSGALRATRWLTRATCYLLTSRAAVSVSLAFSTHIFDALIPPEYPTMEIAMRRSVLLFALVIALSFLAGGIVMAQTMTASSTPATPSKSALRKQDRLECTKQARQQHIARRNQAAFVRQCMADRQGARRAVR